MKIGTVKVTMRVSIAGGPEPVHGLGEFSFRPGQAVELHPDLAAAWIASGNASAWKPGDGQAVAPVKQMNMREAADYLLFHQRARQGRGFI